MLARIPETGWRGGSALHQFNGPCGIFVTSDDDGRVEEWEIIHVESLKIMGDCTCVIMETILWLKLFFQGYW